MFLSFAIVWIVAIAHLRNLRVGSAFQNIWTIVKLLLIGALIVAGLLVDPKQPITFLPQAGDTMSILAAPFAVALVFVMYSYSGWNAAVYITDEIERPEKNVPRALLVGTVVVIVVYTALNAVFLLAAPREELSGQLEVGLIAGKHIFGEHGGRVAGAIICLGLISTISSMMWLGPRVTMAMGEDHWLLRFLGRKNREGVPTNAALVQFVIVNVMLLTKSFELVVVYIGFSLLFCALLTVLGVIVLRFTQPQLARPYRVWAYPLPPIVFAAITLWMMIYLLRSRPTESLSGVATVLVGLALYYLARRRPPSHA
jgi:APA family basic amino acid/polyamine antiporter